MASMEESSNRLNNFKMSAEEVNQFQEALKHEEFRKLLIEFSNELKDPLNRVRYESEMVEYEREKGCDVEFIEPCGNYVIKSWSSVGGKIMINICTSAKVDEPKSEPRDEARGGKEWSIPYIVGSSRKEIDRKKQLCDVIDIIFNPLALQLARQTPGFEKLVHDTALDAAESYLKLDLKKNQLKFPKLVYKGEVQKCMIRTAAKEMPVYEIVHQENSIGVKTGLFVKIKLPWLSSMKDCSLDVTDINLQFAHERYNLCVNLPYKVNSDKGHASFDDTIKTLIVYLPTYESDETLVSVPLSNTPNNNKIQDLEINAIVEEIQAMSVDNATSDETAESSDSDVTKTDSQNTKVTSQNINKIMNESSKNFEVDNVMKEHQTSTEEIVKQVLTDGNLKTGSKELQEKRQLDNKKSIHNYWSDNNENNNNVKKLHLRQQALKTRSFSESSDDWSLSHSPCKGILKSSFSTSSEICQSLERATSLCEEEENDSICISSNVMGSSSSVKKSVSFSDVISKQLFRPDSSILGQRKKNQRRARNKRNKAKRTNSESEDIYSEPEVSVLGSSACNNGEAQVKVTGKGAEFTSDLMFDIDM